MKKLITIMLVLFMALSLAACGGSSASGNSDAAPDNADNSAQEPAGSEADGADDAEEPSGEVVLDNEFCKLTFKGIEEDTGPFFCKLLFAVENKSAEDTLYFDSELIGLSINGYGIYKDSYFNDPIEVRPGESCDFVEIRLFNSVLAAIGVDSIDKIEKIDIVLSGWKNAEDGYTRIIYGECSVYPTGLEGSYVQKARADMPGDETLDGDNFKVTLYWKEGMDFITALKSEGHDDPVIIIENKTGEEYEFMCSDFRINGVTSKATQTGFGAVFGNIKSGGTLVGSLRDDSSYIAHYHENTTQVDSISFEFSVYALSDHPYNRGETLGKFNIMVEPEDIHK